MTDFAPARPLDVIDLLAAERAVLVSLLASLDDNSWRAATECPGWSVHGIACHLIGDDLSLLSRQRDGVPDPEFAANPPMTVPEFLTRLDALNNRFVATMAGLAPTLVVELLQVTGTWTRDWYATVDPERLGESVHWVSPDPAPYWMLAARELVERWIHHHQIRRALGQAWLPDPALTATALAAMMRGFPLSMAVLSAPPGTTLTIAADDFGAASWTLVAGDGGWRLHDGQPDEPTARVHGVLDDLAAVLSRGTPRAEVGERITADGDHELGQSMVAGLAAFFGR